MESGITEYTYKYGQKYGNNIPVLSKFLGVKSHSKRVKILPHSSPTSDSHFAKKNKSNTESLRKQRSFTRAYLVDFSVPNFRRSEISLVSIEK